MSREAIEEAIEVLEDASADMLMETGDKNYYIEAIAVLRQALVDADDTSQERVDEIVKDEQEPVAWQPIESVPKTGRKVILFYKNRLNVGRTVIARWLTDEQATEIDADDVGLEGGWYECIDNWDDFTEVKIHEGEPSHWMPLPAPPIEAKLREKNT
jgi:hypothetical protein